MLKIDAFNFIEKQWVSFNKCFYLDGFQKKKS